MKTRTPYPVQAGDVVRWAAETRSFQDVEEVRRGDVGIALRENEDADDELSTLVCWFEGCKSAPASLEDVAPLLLDVSNSTFKMDLVR